MKKKVYLNVCENCKGYSDDNDKLSCPICGDTLTYKAIDSKDVGKFGNLETMVSDDTDVSDDYDSSDFSSDDSYDTYSSDNDDEYVPVVKKATKSKSSAINPFALLFGSILSVFKKKDTKDLISYTGIVNNYSNSDEDGGNYYRLGITRITDALFYGQRMEDVLHRFRLNVRGERDSDGMTSSDRNIIVNAHGTVVGGARIDNNSVVTVLGRFKNGVLMAYEIKDAESGSVIRFRRSYNAIIAIVSFILLAIMFLYYGISYSNSFSSFVGNIKTFFSIFAVTYVILLAVYLFLSFTKIGMIIRFVSKKGMRVPWLKLMLGSLAITYLIISHLGGIQSAAGTAQNAIAQAISTIIVWAVIIGLIFMFIKSGRG